MKLLKIIRPKEISDKDLRILANFKRYDLKYYNSLKKKKLNQKDMKQRFMLLLTSKNLDSNEIAVIYGFKGRSGLRYEINVLFGKNVSLIFLRSIFSKKDINSYLKEIEKLIETNCTIREISKTLKISTWKVEKLIKNYYNKIDSFAQLRTYLAFNKINPNLLGELEKTNISFEGILIKFILFLLLNKKMDLKDISKTLNLPLTKLENIIYSNNLI